MVDVVGDDGAPFRDLCADKLGRDAFSNGHKFHFWGDDAFAGIVHLCDIGCAPQGRTKRYRV